MGSIRLFFFNFFNCNYKCIIHLKHFILTSLAKGNVPQWIAKLRLLLTSICILTASSGLICWYFMNHLKIFFLKSRNKMTTDMSNEYRIFINKERESEIEKKN